LKLYRDISTLLTLAQAAAKGGRSPQLEDLSPISKAAIVVHNKKIAWCGPLRHLPRPLWQKIRSEQSLQGRVVLPGFVECHTHSLFAGSRAEEFESRLRGASYREIAAAGGGILSTMRATRKASRGALLRLTQQRIDRFVSQGITTLEVKTGYGLSREAELKCLRVLTDLKKSNRIHLVRTFLGAHAKPPEYPTPADYLQFLTTEMLPLVRKRQLAERVDIFVENGFFSASEAAWYLEAARQLGFATTVHADQISLSGGTLAAVQAGALSADHVIQIRGPEIAALASSDTTAVLLPAADIYMQCEFPPARALIDAGARVALATDFNPGTSPTQSVDWVGLLARLEMKMSLAEVLVAWTLNPAYALGLEKVKGSLAVGKDADFISIFGDWQELFYSVGSHSLAEVHCGGKRLFKAE